MLNYIWSGMILIGFIVSVFTGKLEQTSYAALNSSGNAVKMSIELLGIMCLWNGLMKISEKSGLINKLAKVFRPLTKLLFPKIHSQSPAMNAIVLNMLANMMGLSNAATPLGLKAIKELQKINKEKRTASNEMCMLVVLNTASIQVIPSTIIAIRTSAGSANPFEIIVPVWLVSICSVIVGVIGAKIFQKKDKLG